VQHTGDGHVIMFDGPDSHAAEDLQAFQDVDPSSFPATLAAAHAIPVPLDEEFAFGLELIIEGLSGHLA
jgi:TetR/AcrR family transcriptional regulator, tetracycline repressor protein